MVKLMEESINNLEKKNKEYAKIIKELKESIKFDIIEKNKEKNQLNEKIVKLEEENKIMKEKLEMFKEINEPQIKGNKDQNNDKNINPNIYLCNKFKDIPEILKFQYLKEFKDNNNEIIENKDKNEKCLDNNDINKKIDEVKVCPGNYNDINENIDKNGKCLDNNDIIKNIDKNGCLYDNNEKNKNLDKNKKCLDDKNEINENNNNDNNNKLINLNNNLKNDFNGNPNRLKNIDYLLKSDEKGQICFDDFVGLIDKKEYLAYNIKNSLEIITIKDKKKIISLKKHQDDIKVIRYYKNDNNKEDYILSCEKNVLIVWDIQNNYNIKKEIKIENNAYIMDALLLLNISNKNYIIISNITQKYYTALYEFNNDKPKQNIFGTKENQTRHMNLWKKENNYYLIEYCHNQKVSINNIFEDECYANLIKDPEGIHDYGYIYKDKYLCVSDLDNNFIRIWDLFKKSVFKEIKFDAYMGDEIIPWNNKYSIVGCRDCYLIIDIDEEKVEYKYLERIEYSFNFKGIKKIKISDSGECLIASYRANIILLCE